MVRCEIAVSEALGFEAKGSKAKAHRERRGGLVCLQRRQIRGPVAHLRAQTASL